MSNSSTTQHCYMNGKALEELYASLFLSFLGCYRFALLCVASIKLVFTMQLAIVCMRARVCARFVRLKTERIQWQNEIKENKHSQTWIKMSAHISLSERHMDKTRHKTEQTSQKKSRRHACNDREREKEERQPQKKQSTILLRKFNLKCM